MPYYLSDFKLTDHLGHGFTARNNLLKIRGIGISRQQREMRSPPAICHRHINILGARGRYFSVVLRAEMASQAFGYYKEYNGAQCW